MSECDRKTENKSHLNHTWSWAPDGGGDWAAAEVEEAQSLKLSAEPEHTVA